MGTTSFQLFRVVIEDNRSFRVLTKEMDSKLSLIFGLLVAFNIGLSSTSSVSNARFCKGYGEWCVFGFECCGGLDCDGIIGFNRFCKYDKKREVAELAADGSCSSCTKCGNGMKSLFEKCPAGLTCLVDPNAIGSCESLGQCIKEVGQGTPKCNRCIKCEADKFCKTCDSKCGDCQEKCFHCIPCLVNPWGRGCQSDQCQKCGTECIDCIYCVGCPFLNRKELKKLFCVVNYTFSLIF